MSVKELIGNSIDRLDRALCHREEDRARRHGWEVERIGFGARSYRDPRFDERQAQAVPAPAGKRLESATPARPGGPIKIEAPVKIGAPARPAGPIKIGGPVKIETARAR